MRDHCLNVGCVAGALRALLPASIRTLLPSGTNALAALHDIGKITLGFQNKCPAWRIPPELGEQTAKRAPHSVSDHALVSQVFLQKLLKSSGAQLWAAAVGAHHGRPKGRTARLPDPGEAASVWAENHRRVVTEELIREFGGLACKCTTTLTVSIDVGRTIR